MECIQIKGARVNNLKNINLEINRDQLIVVTGVSGSGKSSLAFDTLYAEGQRRYVESLSSYARQFLGRMSKPECDFINGLPPAIAIEQRVSSRNPRSTVGTMTEIYEYLRLLYARFGRTYSPVSGCEVKRHTADDVLHFVLSHAEGEKFMVLVKVDEAALPSKKQQGYAHIYYDAEGQASIVIDRLKVRAGIESRLYDTCETAFAEGNGELSIVFPDQATNAPGAIAHFSTRFEADGITFEEPHDAMFAFSSPSGACPTCGGYGNVVGIDEQLVVPNPTLSVYEGCVQCWHGEKMGQWREEFCRQAASHDFPIFASYSSLDIAQRTYLWRWIDDFFRMVEQNAYKIQYRVMLSRFRGKTLCPDCHGGRLKKASGYVRIADKTITDLVAMPIKELLPWVVANVPSQLDTPRATTKPQGKPQSKQQNPLYTDIVSRLQYLMDVGLGYLTLNRTAATLSGGESQRIKLTTALGSSLVGSLYVLDEPSIGLHPRDTWRLITVLKQLRDVGNTVIVVEHDEDIIAAADEVIEIGPGAGRNGGQVLRQGPPCPPATRSSASPLLASRAWNQSLVLKACSLNNLKGITVEIPLNVLTVVTGVSGSGKSSLVGGTLYPAVKRALGEVYDAPGPFGGLSGDLNAIKHVELVDQSSIGKSTRSNPATYIKAFDHIRARFADQQLSRQMGFTPQHFSFNAEGGRCEECSGNGVIITEMQFMADIELVCESCHGKRFKNEILQVEYNGKNIHDVLSMTVDEALAFFAQEADTPSKDTPSKDAKSKNAKSPNATILSRLQPLHDVGLGYIQLGQSSSTLSGGENQRVKLAYYLAQEKSEPTLFIFDEPTTGLSTSDITILMKALNALVERGHTVVIVEHNLHVIRHADHIIDLGPEGGDTGGQLVYAGPVTNLRDCPESVTAKYL